MPTRVSLFLVLLMILTGFSLHAQGGDQLPGRYVAHLDDDQVVLDIQDKFNGKYPGSMTDRYQRYIVTLETFGEKITGTAKESSLGIEFVVSGKQQGDQLALHFSFEFEGQQNTMDVNFIRQSEVIEHTAQSDGQQLDFPSGAEHPREIVGIWIREEMYQSGYGDQYMGAGFSESMTLLPDGHLAEGGSAVYISGSNYSGHNSGGTDGVLPDVGWYTKGKVFYLLVYENGKSQQVPLGTWYIEGSSMLITASSGDKLLLTKKN